MHHSFVIQVCQWHVKIVEIGEYFRKSVLSLIGACQMKSQAQVALV